MWTQTKVNRLSKATWPWVTVLRLTWGPLSQSERASISTGGRNIRECAQEQRVVEIQRTLNISREQLKGMSVPLSQSLPNPEASCSSFQDCIFIVNSTFYSGHLQLISLSYKPDNTLSSNHLLALGCNTRDCGVLELARVASPSSEGIVRISPQFMFSDAMSAMVVVFTPQKVVNVMDQGFFQKVGCEIVMV